MMFLNLMVLTYFSVIQSHINKNKIIEIDLVVFKISTFWPSLGGANGLVIEICICGSFYNLEK